MNESELVWVRNLTAPAKKLGHSKSEVPAGLKLWLPGVVTSKVGRCVICWVLFVGCQCVSVSVCQCVSVSVCQCVSVWINI